MRPVPRLRMESILLITNQIQMRLHTVIYTKQDPRDKVTLQGKNNKWLSCNYKIMINNIPMQSKEIYTQYNQLLPNPNLQVTHWFTR